jgi:hypothetical protein
MENLHQWVNYERRLWRMGTKQLNAEARAHNLTEDEIRLGRYAIIARIKEAAAKEAES